MRDNEANEISLTAYQALVDNEPGIDLLFRDTRECGHPAVRVLKAQFDENGQYIPYSDKPYLEVVTMPDGYLRNLMSERDTLLNLARGILSFGWGVDDVLDTLVELGYAEKPPVEGDEG